MPIDTKNFPLTDHIPSKAPVVAFCVDVLPSHVSISPAEPLLATIYSVVPCAAKPLMWYPAVKPRLTVLQFNPASVDWYNVASSETYIVVPTTAK